MMCLTLVVFVALVHSALAGCFLSPGLDNLKCTDTPHASWASPPSTTFKSITLIATTGTLSIPADYFKNAIAPEILIKCKDACTAIDLEGDIFTDRKHFGSIVIHSVGDIHFAEGQAFHNMSGDADISISANGQIEIDGSAFTMLAGDPGSSFKGKIKVFSGGDIVIPDHEFFTDIAYGVGASVESDVTIEIGGNFASNTFFDRCPDTEESSFVGDISVHVNGDWQANDDFFNNFADSPDSSYAGNIHISVGGNLNADQESTEIFNNFADGTSSSVESNIHFEVGGDLTIEDDAFYDFADAPDSRFIGDIFISVGGNLHAGEDLFNYIGDSSDSTYIGDIYLAVGGNLTIEDEFMSDFGDGTRAMCESNIRIEVGGDLTTHDYAFDEIADSTDSVYVGVISISVGGDLHAEDSFFEDFGGGLRATVESKVIIEVAGDFTTIDGFFFDAVGVDASVVADVSITVGGDFQFNTTYDDVGRESVGETFCSVANMEGASFEGDIKFDVGGDLISHDFFVGVANEENATFIGDVKVNVGGDWLVTPSESQYSTDSFQGIANDTGTSFIGDIFVNIKGDLSSDGSLFCSVGGSMYDGDIRLGVCGDSTTQTEGCMGEYAEYGGPVSDIPSIGDCLPKFEFDYCANYDKTACRSREAKRWLGCKWSKGSCSVKNPKFVQPTPLVCEGACCELNKRACRGKGSTAKAWSKANDKDAKKACKFTNDKSMQNETPDGKHFGQCMTK